MALIKSTEQRLAFLDSLRGLAATYVALFHMTLVPSPHLLTPEWLIQIVSFGGSGVSLFFIVSAFSLCLTMPLHESETPDLLAFYIRRFFRIAPLFYFMIAVTLVRDHYYFGETHSVYEILASVGFLFNFLPYGYEGIVWASWTIGVEMVFYLVFPFFYKTSNNLVKIIIAILIFLIVSAFFKEVIFYASWLISFKKTFYHFSFFHQLPIFIFGILGYYFVSKHKELNLTKSVGSALILGAFYGFYGLMNDGFNFFFPDHIYWQAVFYTMLLVGLSAYPVRILVNRFTCFLGKISYSIYLSHPIVIVFLFPVYKLIYTLALPNTLKFFASAFLTGICVISVSCATYFLVEKPGITLGRQLLNRAFARNLFSAPKHNVQRSHPRP